MLSRAGLAMVAPTPNDPWLTVSTQGFTLYPTGMRNFVRLSFGNDQEGVAAAHLASRLGVHRAYVYLDDPKGFLRRTMAQPFARAARGLGIHVIGPDSPTGGFRRLSRGLKARGVDGVFLAVGRRVTARLIGALRAGLGRSATLIGADTFLPLHLQRRRGLAGPSAGCTYWGRTSQTQPDNCHLPAGVRRRLRRHPPSRAKRCLGTRCRPGDRRAPDRDRAIRRHPRIGHPPTVSSARQKRHPGQLRFTPRGDISPATVLVYRVIRGPPWTRPVRTITTPATGG